MNAVAETADSPAADARRQLIEERRRRSLFWKTVHWLGSLKLAMLLLATIAIACGVATFCESAFNAKVASAYIYKAPWFLFWLGILCVNLLAVTLTRWPWQRHHAGFIVTHYGIILLLAGAVIGSQLGFEGNVTLRKGGPPVHRITTSRSVVQFDDSRGGNAVMIPFDAEISRPSEKNPKVFAPPGFPTQVVVDGASGRLVERGRLEASPAGGSGAEVEFSTAMMGQDLTLPFALRADGGMDRDFFGMAMMSFLPSLPDRAPKPVSETRMIFAKYAPVSQGAGSPAELELHLSEDGGTIAAVAPGMNEAQSIPRAGAMGKRTAVGGSSFEAVSYWPDFRIQDGQPSSASDQPNNPALLVRITGPSAPAGEPGKPLLEMAPTKDGLAYQISRDGRVSAAGVAKVGETFPLGWADWKATVKRLEPRAEIASSFEPGPEGSEGIPGFRARLRSADGVEGPPQWVASGSFTTLSHPAGPTRVIYGLESRPVPFGIRLADFEVPRLEGTETPSNFIASVEFRDSKTGETKTGVAKMNHPASWPGGAFALITGWNYKFSQAQWNPQDLEETTLQVLYDPGWLLKWFGSLAICAGIFMMFYLRPKKS